MKRYIGCDVHAISCSFVHKSATGRRLRHDVVETNGRALRSYVRSIRGEVHLCIEEGEWSQWLVELLSPLVAELVVVIPERSRGVTKSDKIDASKLSDALWMGKDWRRVYKDPHRFRRLKELSRAYRLVTGDQVRVKNRIKSFYRGRGIRTPGDGVYDPSRRASYLRRLPSATRHAVELLNEELDLVMDLKREAERRLVRESHRHRVSRILETAPGLGPVRVAQILPILMTPHRFRTSRQLWAYSGFGVTSHTSNDYVQRNGQWVRGPVVQTRGLNRHHNRQLKAIFKGAATTVCAHTPGHPLHAHYERLLAGGLKPNLAKLTIARKIAATVLAMWKESTPYDPRRHQVA